MGVVIIILSIIHIFLLVYFLSSSIYFLFFAISGRFRKSFNTVKNESINRRFAILIPSYKEDSVISGVAKHALNQDYQSDLFDVFVIADSLKNETVLNLQSIPVNVIEVNFEESTKSKSLKHAISLLPESKYQAVIILDADNIMAFNFISKMNACMSDGYSSIQGHRKAKNMNTSIAILDAVSEEVNNHIFRKGHRAVGLTSSLIGSAMCFDFTLFKELIFQTKTSGEDKELEFLLIKNGIITEYLEDAIVYDEKVQSGTNFSNQRRRWLSLQLYFLKKNLIPALFSAIQIKNINYLNKTLHMLFPPRLLLIGFTFIFSVLSILINPFWLTILWTTAFLFSLIAIYISIPHYLLNKKTFFAFLSIPSTFLLMLKSVLNIRGAHKTFIHTPHSSNEIPDNQNLINPNT